MTTEGCIVMIVYAVAVIIIIALVIIDHVKQERWYASLKKKDADHELHR